MPSWIRAATGTNRAIARQRLGERTSPLPHHRADRFGRTYLACALGHQVCREGNGTLYYYAPKFFRAIQIAQADGSLPTLLKKLQRAALLLIDDFGAGNNAGKQYREMLEILDERQGLGSTLITSQFPTSQWHDIISDATVADAIMDRLVHNAYRIELVGESIRKPKSTAPPER